MKVYLTMCMKSKGKKNYFPLCLTMLLKTGCLDVTSEDVDEKKGA